MKGIHFICQYVNRTLTYISTNEEGGSPLRKQKKRLMKGKIEIPSWLKKSQQNRTCEGNVGFINHRRLPFSFNDPVSLDSSEQSHSLIR